MHCRAPTSQFRTSAFAAPSSTLQVDPCVYLQSPHLLPALLLQVIDQMLRKDYLFDIALPRLPSRVTLERVGQLEPRISVLDEEFDEAALEVGGSVKTFSAHVWG